MFRLVFLKFNNNWVIKHQFFVKQNALKFFSMQ